MPYIHTDRQTDKQTDLPEQ